MLGGSRNYGIVKRRTVIMRNSSYHSIPDIYRRVQVLCIEVSMSVRRGMKTDIVLIIGLMARYASCSLRVSLCFG